MKTYLRHWVIKMSKSHLYHPVRKGKEYRKEFDKKIRRLVRDPISDKQEFHKEGIAEKTQEKHDYINLSRK